MSASAGTIGAPRRAGMDPATRQVLQVALVLAISIGAIVALTALPERVVGVDDRVASTQVGDVDARWSAKWGAASAATAETATAEEASTADTRWAAKQWRAEAATGLDRSEARGSEGG